LAPELIWTLQREENVSLPPIIEPDYSVVIDISSLPIERFLFLRTFVADFDSIVGYMQVRHANFLF
jgi:hypothetical protein